MGKIELTYLDHSGFVVELAEDLLVFDYYRDPAQKMPEFLTKQKRIWVFSSHWHPDHFVASIADWEKHVNAYILSDDIRKKGGLSGVAESKIRYCKPYQKIEFEEMTITTFGSTDAGVSFLVETAERSIFHAGDLNRWHWTGESLNERRQADGAWHSELKKLAGRSFDLAFFPLDQRLGEYRAAGAFEFCQALKISLLVAMHQNGAAWQAPHDFPAPVWSPSQQGETLSIE